MLGVIYVPAKHVLFWGTREEGAYRADVDAHTLQRSNVKRIPLQAEESGCRPYRVVASRSHLSAETQQLIDGLRSQHPDLDLVSAGSSLKLCLVAEGKADIYPRLAPTMEWDTAAGHAIALAAGCTVVDADSQEPLHYNKEDLHNPYFIVERVY